MSVVVSYSAADEVEEPDTIITDPELMGELQDIMHSLKIAGSSGLMYTPHERVSVPPPDKDGVDPYVLNLALIDAFEDCEVVDQVFHNMKLRS